MTLKKIISVFIILLLAVFLCCCGDTPSESEEEYTVTIADPDAASPSVPVSDEKDDGGSSVSTDSPAVSPSPEPTPSPTPVVYPDVTIGKVNTHMDLDGRNIDDIIRNFCEVVLSGDYLTDSTDKVYKWTSPISCYFLTECTEEDMAAFNAAAEILNSVEGFPGISSTTWEPGTNVNIVFCDRFDFIRNFGKYADYEEADAIFRYFIDSQTRTITSAYIYIRTDIDQTVRNGVIAEQLMRITGVSFSTDSRQDSVLYSGYSFSRSISEEDKEILQLLYSEEISCGMDWAHCAAVIKAIYE